MLLAAAFLWALLPANWVYLGGNAGVAVYVDTSRTTRQSGIATAWFETRYKLPLGGRVAISRVRMEHDCAKGVHRRMETSRYTAADTLIETVAETDRTWWPQDKTTIVGQVMTQVCTGKGGSKVADPAADSRLRFKG